MGGIAVESFSQNVDSARRDHGGARGIGRATAEACFREGMSVVIGDIDGDVVAVVAAELGPRVVGSCPVSVTGRGSSSPTGLPGLSSRSCASG
jgi:hypothetical protein